MKCYRIRTGQFGDVCPGTIEHLETRIHGIDPTVPTDEHDLEESGAATQVEYARPPPRFTSFIERVRCALGYCRLPRSASIVRELPEHAARVTIGPGIPVINEVVELH